MGEVAPGSRTLTVTVKRCKHLQTRTYLLKANETGAYVSCFQHICPEVEPSRSKQHMRHAQRKRASVLVRQPSLQHKGNIDVLLISSSLYWPLSSYGCKLRPCSFVHTQELQKTLASLTVLLQSTHSIEITFHRRRGVGQQDRKTMSWRWGYSALSLLDCRMARTMKRTREVCFAHCYHHS